MNAYLLDTCVMIDDLRDRQEAVQLVHQAGARPSVSAVTVAAVFAGARATTEQRRINGLLHQQSIRDVDLQIARLGGA